MALVQLSSLRWLCVAMFLVACQSLPVADQLVFSFEGQAGSGERRVLLRDVVFEPAANVQSAQLDARGRMLVARRDRARPLTVRASGLCPVTVGAGPQAAALALQPLLDLGADRTAVGFDARFSVRARRNCPALAAGQISWQQVEGPALRELTQSADGELSARMPSFAELHPEPLPRGIVPISPRTQGRVVLEAKLKIGPQVAATRRLTLSAAARSTGLSSIAVSQPVLISGTGWHVEHRPVGGRATVQALDGLTSFTADVPGGWSLARDEPGHEPTTLKLNSLTHDATPYDCARSECHAELSALAASTAMSHALDRALDSQTDSAAVSCMLDCHVLGERGLSDGGFRAVAERLGFTWTEHTRWQDLPQALRRLGGVRCTGCHGPGAIPPPEQRNAILRSDVCASCHDAPPRYVHVSEWRSGAMARSDSDPATRAPSCARCHTTAGFLAHNGARKRSEDQADDPTGIACAACHAPHAAHRGPRLLRNIDRTAVDACAVRTRTGASDWVEETDARGGNGAVGAGTGAAAVGAGAGAAVIGAGTGAAAIGAGAGAAAVGAGAGAAAVEVRTALCRGCHAPAGDLAEVGGSLAPGGTLAAAEVLVPAADGGGWERLQSGFAHAQVPMGCVGCHGGAALGEGHVNHSFRAEPRVCASCHVQDALQAGSQAGADLQRRARELSDKLARFCSKRLQAPSAHPQLEAASCVSKALERAQYEVSLVLQDEAAAFHNARLAHALLLDVELQLRNHSTP